jgi:hypothetical protein
MRFPRRASGYGLSIADGAETLENRRSPVKIRRSLDTFPQTLYALRKATGTFCNKGGGSLCQDTRAWLKLCECGASIGSFGG